MATLKALVETETVLDTPVCTFSSNSPKQYSETLVIRHSIRQQLGNPEANLLIKSLKAIEYFFGTLRHIYISKHFGKLHTLKYRESYYSNNANKRKNN